MNSQLLCTQSTINSRFKLHCCFLCSWLYQWLDYVHPSHPHYWSLLGYLISLKMVLTTFISFLLLVPPRLLIAYETSVFVWFTIVWNCTILSYVCNCLHQCFPLIKLIIPTSRVMTLSIRSKRSGICIFVQNTAAFPWCLPEWCWHVRILHIHIRIACPSYVKFFLWMLWGSVCYRNHLNPSSYTCRENKNAQKLMRDCPTCVSISTTATLIYEWFNLIIVDAEPHLL